MIGTGTAIALGATQLGGQIVGAVTGNRAADKAAKQQAEAARQALALQQQMYEQTRADLSPYRQQGGQGLTALSALLGLPQAPPEAAPVARADLAAPPTLPPAMSHPSQVLRGLAEEGVFGPDAIQVPRALYEQWKKEGLTGQQMHARATQMRAAGGGAPGQVGPTTGQPGVQMRSPTGQVQVVPADQASFYEARGARRV